MLLFRILATLAVQAAAMVLQPRDLQVTQVVTEFVAACPAPSTVMIRVTLAAEGLVASSSPNTSVLDRYGDMAVSALATLNSLGSAEVSSSSSAELSMFASSHDNSLASSSSSVAMLYSYHSLSSSTTPSSAVPSTTISSTLASLILISSNPGSASNRYSHWFVSSNSSATSSIASTTSRPYADARIRTANTTVSLVSQLTSLMATSWSSTLSDPYPYPLASDVVSTSSELTASTEMSATNEEKEKATQTGVTQCAFPLPGQREC